MLPNRTSFNKSVCKKKLVTTWLNSDSMPEMKSGAFSLLQKTGFVPKGMTESAFLESLMDGAEVRSGIPKNSAIDKLHQGLQLLSAAKGGEFAQVEEIEMAINRILNSHDHEKAKLPIDIHSMHKKTFLQKNLPSCLSFTPECFCRSDSYKGSRRKNRSE
ncbi:hypothetical protein AB9M93_01005 [Peribacillus frigoritolerans]|uniref:hypothetical protein n=1 Tax=Peribacillus frigoritolerans TaxID=450367 RepID=UPI00351859FD